MEFFVWAYWVAYGAFFGFCAGACVFSVVLLSRRLAAAEDDETEEAA